jgi:peptidylprolyl isomerase
MLSVIEVAATKKLPTRAEGEPVKPAEGLPTVTLADDGKPSITIPDGFPEAKELVAQPLIKGAGAKVTPKQTVTVQYSGWTLDGKQFDSSWERGAPISFPLSNVIKGWTDGLSGQTVGSQVLLVVPAAQAYGAKADGSHELAGKTLVFVVDILDAE